MPCSTNVVISRETLLEEQMGTSLPMIYTGDPSQWPRKEGKRTNQICLILYGPPGFALSFSPKSSSFG